MHFLKILAILLSLTVAVINAQNSFSPFSFLNSFLSQVPGWPLQHNPGHNHHHNPVKQQQRSTNKQKQNIFRPHLQLSPSISSQSLPVVRAPPPPHHVISSVPQHQATHTHQTGGGGSSSGGTIFIGSPQLVDDDQVSTLGNDPRQIVESRNNKNSDISSSASSAPAVVDSSDISGSVTASVASFKKTDTSSGPNPGEDEFPIISLIDDSGVNNYYDNVLQNINTRPFRSSPTLSPAFSSNTFPASSPAFINNLYNNNNNFDTSSNSFTGNSLNSLNINPYYAPEEFTYNQDPILIDHADNDEASESFKEIVEENKNDDREVSEVKSTTTEKIIIEETERNGNNNRINLVNKKEQIAPTLIPTFFEEIEEIAKKTEKSSRSLSAKDVFRKRVKAKELTNLVATIEYEPPDDVVEEKTNNLSDTINYITNTVKCPELKEIGFCAQDNSYPHDMVTDLVSNCSILSSFSAFVPEDVDTLGDNSDSIISSEKDSDRPWSWRVSAYNKRQVCDSYLSFIRPSYVLDSRGEHHLIIQTEKIVQSVSVDICQSPGSPCPGLSQCGVRSLCVQRYHYQYLLSLPTSSPSSSCPVITAVKFPSGCVCHSQVSENIFGDKLV